MIYTSSFEIAAKHARVISGELRAMSIALDRPSGWPIDDVVYCLRPWPFMERYYREGNLTAYGYEDRYRVCVLQHRCAEWVAEHYDNVVMCCTEKPEEWCHRRVVRAWFGEKGIEVHELTGDPVGEEKKSERKERVVQLTLL